MFQFPRFASLNKLVIPVLQTGGLSHSEIRASKVICTYTQLITSFIASVSQGIRHAPFITFFLPTSLIKNLIIEVHKKYSKKKEKEKARSPYFSCIV